MLGRFLVLLALAATSVWAADYENSQGARLVIGQPSFTAERPVSSQQALGGAGGVAVAGNRLFIVDSNHIGAGPVNHRLLIYDNLSGFLPAPDAELPQGTSCPACVGLATTVLGQPDFDKNSKGLENGFNSPTAVASDGIRIALADTDNNRVLIWRTVPSVNGAPPDLVVGQPDFKTYAPRTDQTGLRGPQGVWFYNGKLIIADTLNSRVLIYNSIPNANGAGADIVLGQPDFNTKPHPDLTVSNIKPSANSMLDPVSATTVGNKLIVTDLGFNRVLIFSSFPTSNFAPADLVIGQPDMNSGVSNNSTKDSQLCAPNSKDANGGDVYPSRCAATLSFPRFALSDGTRLFIADGGNDRVLIYNTFPTANSVPADVVLGQKDFIVLEDSNGAGRLRAPSALAHDGVNLYVADPFSRRILVFTPAERMVSDNGVVNAASFQVNAQGFVTLDGNPKKDDEVKVTIKGRDYSYKAAEGDTLEMVRDALLHQINEDPGDPLVYGRASVGQGAYSLGSVAFGGEIQAGDVITIRIQNRLYRHTVLADDTVEGMVYHFSALIRDEGQDPDVYADPDPSDPRKLRLTARLPGPQGDNINYEATVSDGAVITAQTEGDYLFGGRSLQNLLLVARSPGADGDNIDIAATISGTTAGITVTTSGANLTWGNDAGEAPPGTQIAIFGENLASTVASADPAAANLPRELADTRVYVNGIQAPLYTVGPTQINAQVPFEIEGTSTSVYVRTRRADGQVAVSVARPVAVTRAAPGLYAQAGPEPRVGVAVHGMAFARGTVAIDITSGDTTLSIPADIPFKITVNDRNYEYVTVDGDTTDSIRDKMVDLINNAPDPDVEASAARVGFLSARARFTFGGKIKAGDIVTITINGRNYKYTVKSTDNLTTVANRLIAAITAGAGDPDVTATLSSDVGVIAIDVVARKLGIEGNDVGLSVSVSANADITVTSDAKDNKLVGGSTPSAVLLTARRPGKQGDDIRYSVFVPGGSAISATAQTSTLCCGNDLFAPVTPENPAVPGEIIVVFGTGLGLTTPSFGQDGLESGRKVPDDPRFLVPANPDDFVSSLAGGKTASVDFVGLMPGQVGVYQINLVLNSDLPDDPMTRVTIAQGLFVSNIITVPVRNRTPRRTQ